MELRVTLLRRKAFTTTLLLGLLALPGVGRGQRPLTPSVTPAAPAPNPDASGIYNVSSGMPPPKLVFAPEPEFSKAARKSKIGGNCTVSLVVDAGGQATEVHIVHSAAESQPRKLKAAAVGLDQKAVEAVQLYRFEPATLNGKPISIRMNVEVNFQVF